MVGFGSTFRMCRRKGWEPAYCDYETLKLLLTHIEAVYEEHDNNDYDRDGYFGYGFGFGFGQEGYGSVADEFYGFRNEDAFDQRKDEDDDHEHDHDLSDSSNPLNSLNRAASRRRSRNRRQNRNQNRNQNRRAKNNSRKKSSQQNAKETQKKRTDWRDELFAESDSSAAFASSEYEYEYEFDSEEDENGIDPGHGQGRMNKKRDGSDHMRGTAQGAMNHSGHGHGHGHGGEQHQLPSLDSANFNYSYEHGYVGSSGSFGGMLGSGASSSFGAHSVGAYSAGVSAGGGSGVASFGSSKSGGSLEYQSTSNAINNSNAFMTVSETYPMLGRSTNGSRDSGSAGSKKQNVQKNYQWSQNQSSQSYTYQQPIEQHQRSGVQGVGASGLGTNMKSSKYNSLPRHSEPKPRQPKRRRLYRRSNVPPHIRHAHEKARAITGRFLGLLRAEVDKISLFTHSRMGELTDTIGSLRFPSDEQNMNADGGEYSDMGYGYRHHSGGTSGSHLEHPLTLSDGGIHPSASSSSEDISMSSEEDGNKGDNSNTMFRSNRGRNRRKNIHRDNNRRRQQDSRLDFEQIDRIVQNPNLEGLGLDEEFLKSTTFRQLRLGEELRLTRPIFQRSDQVLGEDFLLLSAVDEADAFTAVGVEFIHLLRYIFVNAIAIRKLCKKHDYLLNSRMLGGYYHRLEKEKDGWKYNANVDLGMDDDYNAMARPRRHGRKQRKLRTQMTPKRKNTKLRRKKRSSELPLPTHSYTSMHRSPKGKNKLVGAYDSQIQQLANSIIAKTLSDSLCLALSEFEESRRRADRLSAFHPIQKNRIASHESLTDLVSVGADDLCHGFPSPKTFGFSISKKMTDDFKEGGYDLSGDEKSEAHSTYSASANSLTRFRFVATSVVTLRDAAAEKQHAFSEYLSRSALITNGREFVGEPFGLNGCSRETLDFFVSYNPDYALILDCNVLQDALSNQDHILSLSYLIQVPCNLAKTEISTASMESSVHSTMESIGSGGVSPQQSSKSLGTQSYQNMFFLNLTSVMLSTMNYYIVLPSAATFCCSLGWKYAHSALLIGSSNVTALLALLYYTCRLQAPQEVSFKKMLILSALCPLVGNIFYVKGYEHNLFSVSILGRLLIGFSSADMINKQLVVTYRFKGDLVSELTKIRMVQLISIFTAILMGTINFEEKRIFIHGELFIFDFNTISGYIMAVAWILQLLGLTCSRFPQVMPERSPPDKSAEIYLSASEHEDPQQYLLEKDYLLPGLLARARSVSDTEGSNMNEAFKKKEGEQRVQVSISDQIKSIVSMLKKTKKLVLHNIALPITFLVYGFVCLSIEIYLTSSVIITSRYFQWNGVQGGRFLALLSFWVLPTYFVMSYVITQFGERFVIKKSLMVMFFGILLFVNYEALYILFEHIGAIFRQDKADEPLTTYYDWEFGMPQYCCSIIVMFLASVTLEGSSLSLLSKVSPDKLNRSTINCAVIVSIISYLGRIIGDAVIVAVGFSHREINTDLVNSISFVLLALCYCCYHVVKKHYFFLTGS